MQPRPRSLRREATPPPSEPAAGPSSTRVTIEQATPEEHRFVYSITLRAAKESGGLCSAASSVGSHKALLGPGSLRVNADDEEDADAAEDGDDEPC